MEVPGYIRYALMHLSNTVMYEIITLEQGQEDIYNLKWEIFEWTITHRKALTKQTVAYLRKKLEITRKDPFGYFYLLYKFHKNPISTIPVCSDCSSLPHALGQWMDEQLQPIVVSQETYIKYSFSFKADISALRLPPNTIIFTYDAVSMYTNINTDDCVASISEFIKNPSTKTRFPHYNTSAPLKALTIVMKNNRMKFGDLLVKQLTGIAMGMSPAPTIANLFVAIHKATHILQFLLSFLMWLRCYIDDGFGIWLHDTDTAVDTANWEVFKAAINSSGLKWTFSSRGKKVVFLNMVVEIVGDKLETDIHHKPQALHLYLPPNSCHAPGVIYGLICGMVL